VTTRTPALIAIMVNNGGGGPAVAVNAASNMNTSFRHDADDSFNP